MFSSTLQHFNTNRFRLFSNTFYDFGLLSCDKNVYRNIDDIKTQFEKDGSDNIGCVGYEMLGLSCSNARMSMKPPGCFFQRCPFYKWKAPSKSYILSNSPKMMSNDANCNEIDICIGTQNKEYYLYFIQNGKIVKLAPCLNDYQKIDLKKYHYMVTLGSSISKGFEYKLTFIHDRH